MRKHSRGVAWALAYAGLFVVATWRWQSSNPADVARRRDESLLAAIPIAPTEVLDSIVHAVTANDPFRVTKASASARYSPRGEPRAVAATSTTRLPHPTLTLRAIAGPPWQALIDGLPGHSGAALVRVGAIGDDLTIRSITRDAVVVCGLDTTWVLRFAGRL
jgi:hypothetical protein